MILHENTLISEDVLEKKFICDLNACKGACCVEGDFGAPISEDERLILLENFDAITPFLSKDGLNTINEKGISELDDEKVLVTTCIPSGACVFAVKNGNVVSCGIENAYKAGKIDFQKPISCHLYPIRISKVSEFDALNYHKWVICKPACILGEKHQVPVYKFLKQPLIRKYGEHWYNELESIGEAWEDENT